MAKNKKIINPTISISPESLMELLWTSMRYCVGRHTSVSMNAEMMWRIIRDNRDKFREDRLLFFARDIRSEISESVRWWQNCHVDNTSNDHIRYDAYSLLVQYLDGHPEVDYFENDFDIDCISGEVSHTKAATSYKGNIWQYPDFDLPEWIKLANCIDRQLIVSLSDGDKTENRLCVAAPAYRYGEDGKFQNAAEMRYFNADRWACFAPNEYIKSVKPIEQ